MYPSISVQSRAVATETDHWIHEASNVCFLAGHRKGPWLRTLVSARLHTRIIDRSHQGPSSLHPTPQLPIPASEGVRISGWAWHVFKIPR